VNYSRTIATAVAVLLGAAMPMMGAQAAQYTEQEQEAIAVVKGFHDALSARSAGGGESKMPILPIAEKYVAENYHQNSPSWTHGQGRESLIRWFQNRGGDGSPRKPPKVLYIGAVGNLVVRASELGTSGLIFNMYTVENGKLVEHWDAVMGGGMDGR